MPRPLTRLRHASSTPTLKASVFITFLLCWTFNTAEPALAADRPANVDAARLGAADKDAANWMTYGRDYGEQRFSPLARISDQNVKQLRLAWHVDLDTNRGQEATPLVIDGVMYVSTAWSLVKAFDAGTGALLWSYDPNVPHSLAVNGCCDVVNRGVAAWKGRIYVGTFDGRLICLDARTGKPIWSITTTPKDKPYTITQAPRVIKGRVVIGCSGSEYWARGFISAYDADTGALVWRFFTVPGDPSQPVEDPILTKAASTWSGEWWKRGGGGTVWESISYDPELDLIYFGTGNGLEWDHTRRSGGRGDNWFLASIVAINADTGRYAWHYQATPGDEWDYDAVQQLILTELVIDGVKRPVLMQANKNGFFYVLDRRTGALLSAKNFTRVTWASAIDPKSGRPVENRESRYDKTGKPAVILPGALGAHSWQAMAFNPAVGLVYIPAQEIGMSYASLKHFSPQPMGWNIGTATTNTPDVKGSLIAWDPVNQKEIWHLDQPGPWNGGVLTTAGNLVVEGNAAGELSAYRADTGEKLWSMSVGSPVMAAPMTYAIGTDQYLAVLTGWGGAFPLLEGKESGKSGNTHNISRVLVFKLDGKDTLPPPAIEAIPALNPPGMTGTPASVAMGEALFGRFCSVCHGEAAIGGGVVPDLRRSPFLNERAWNGIVLEGALQDGGMASFKSVLDNTQATAIRDYIVHRATDEKRWVEAGKPRQPDPKHGAIVVAQGAAAGGPACALCHAFAGSSDSSGTFPRIAGQPASYMAKQLRDLSSGVRLAVTMTPIAQRLTSEEIDDVAAYYASIQTPFPPLPDPDPMLSSRGKSLAESGNAKAGVPPCDTCHSAGGTAQAPTMPYLAGQYAHYTESELQGWQRGSRKNSAGVMAIIARKLDDQDIASIAAYYQQVRSSASAVTRN
jgi:quinohemoprotein ethanol dehydrogenase